MEEHNFLVRVTEDMEKLIPEHVVYLRNNLSGKSGEIQVKTPKNAILRCDFNDSTTRTYWMNTEQLSSSVWQESLKSWIRKSIDKGYTIMDYSRENKEIMESKISELKKNASDEENAGWFYREIVVIEPVFMNNYNHQHKRIPIVSLFGEGYFGDYRKKTIESHLPKLYGKGYVQNFHGMYDTERKDMYCKSKILLNIHAKEDYRIAELFRIHEAISCRCIIVSQRCHREDLVTLKEYIFFEDDDTLESKCEEILDDYENYYEKVYGKKTDLQIFSDILKNNSLAFNKMLH